MPQRDGPREADLHGSSAEEGPISICLATHEIHEISQI